MSDLSPAPESAPSAPPQPSITPSSISPAELLALMQDPEKVAGRDYVVVDVRRTDIDEAPNNVVHPSAINLPAQTFYQTLPVVYELLHRIPIVIFHCNSCRGRGPRCAGWYADELAQRGCETSEAVILEGGLNAWKEAYPELVKTVS